MNKGESENGDNVGDYGDDDDSHGDAEGVVGDRTEDLADDHVVHYCETAADYYVQDRAKLCTPPAEGIAGGCDCAEPELEDC